MSVLWSFLKLEHNSWLWLTESSMQKIAGMEERLKITSKLSEMWFIKLKNENTLLEKKSHSRTFLLSRALFHVSSDSDRGVNNRRHYLILLTSFFVLPTVHEPISVYMSHFEKCNYITIIANTITFKAIFELSSVLNINEVKI